MQNRSVRKNYIYNTSYQILAIITPIITTPYVSRTLGAESVGIFNYIYSIATIFSLICALGTRAYGQREIAYNQNNIDARSKVFYEIIYLKAIVLILTSILYFALAMILDTYTIFLLPGYFYVLASFFDISWLFQGMEDFPKTVIRNTVVKILSIVMVFIFVKSENDITKYILIMGGSTFAGQIYMWSYLPQVINRCNKTERNIVKHLKPAFILFLPSIATYVYTSLDKVMLGTMSSQSEVGYYSQSEKIVKLVMTIVTSLGTVLIPRMANLIKRKDWEKVKQYFENSVQFVFFIGLPMTVGLAFVANQFIPIFLGNGYTKSIILLQLLSPLIMIIGIASVTGQTVLISMGKQSYYTFSVLCGAISNCVLNFILIPHQAAIGASIATLVAEIIVTLMQLAGVRQLISFKAFITKNYKYLIGSALMSIAIFITENILKSILVQDFFVLMAKILIGILTYFITLLVLHDEMLKAVLGKIVKK